MLTLKEARKRVKEIKEITGDPEHAHGEEDELYHDFVKAVATGEIAGDEAAQIAKVLLKTEKIDFPRWTA